MPIIDNKRGVLVIRLVYDGPPMSGKTTSLRTLARGLGVAVETPEESDGRTLYFDWMDYVGGLFEGRQIRCQVVSVPGQAEHAKRRRKLLASADAVILVADTRASALPAAYATLRDLLPHCRSQDPPVGVVLQANKRDAPDSVPREQLQAEFGAIAPLAIVETVATAGDGIREAFVFGIRLALDRVRALADAGRLPSGEPEINRAAELLARLRAGEQAPEVPLAPAAASGGARPHIQTLRPVAPLSSALDREIDLLSVPRPDTCAMDGLAEVTFVPDPLLPGGFIWPPVDGRVLLHEVAQLGVTPTRTARGDWWACARGCRFHSAAGAIFDNADRGREALIEWARLHATQLPKLSSGRTVILASAGAGRYRLWQLVRAEQALRERLAASMAQVDPQQLARDLVEGASHLLQARANLHTQELGLPCTLWTVSADVLTQPRFVGLMPEVGLRAAEEPIGADLVAREFTPLLQALRQQHAEYPQVVESLARSRSGRRDTAAAEFLAQLA
jgi:signal recognition particle receptor subunit beta